MTPTPALPGPVVEVVPDTDPPPPVVTVGFAGRRFAVRDGMSLLPLMKFATIARRQSTGGGGSEGQQEMEALAALYDLLQQCIAPAEWDAFYDHALDTGAGQEELMAVVGEAVSAAAARPTRQPSGSPGGPSPTELSSAAG